MRSTRCARTACLKPSLVLANASQALRAWVVNLSTTHYIIGSAIGPHPFPTIVRTMQSVIGNETKEQMQTLVGKLPDAVVACVGGGSNAVGMFYPFSHDTGVKLLGVEAGGDGTPRRFDMIGICADGFVRLGYIAACGHAERRLQGRPPRCADLRASKPARPDLGHPLRQSPQESLVQGIVQKTPLTFDYYWLYRCLPGSTTQVSAQSCRPGRTPNGPSSSLPQTRKPLWGSVSCRSSKGSSPRSRRPMLYTARSNSPGPWTRARILSFA